MKLIIVNLTTLQPSNKLLQHGILVKIQNIANKNMINAQLQQMEDLQICLIYVFKHRVF
ncbi:MAG: hypothetical protein ACR5KW_03270 [Wolbachia sp.]